MSKVGDIIQWVRSSVPDPPQTMSPPVFVSGQVSAASGGTLSGTVYLVLTALTAWGESLSSAEVTYAIGGGGAFTVTSQLPPSAVGMNLYMGTSAGGENQQFNLAVSGVTASVTVQGNTGVAATPPLNSSAWLPDTDGGFLSASGAYRLLNLATQEMGRVVGGIKGLAGIQSTLGIPMYRSPVGWFFLSNVWYDGWQCRLSNPNEIFLFNNVQGVTALVSAESEGVNPMIQLWPQPVRTGGVTTAAAAIAATDTTIQTTGITIVNFYPPAPVVDGFLQLGLMQIDQEMIQYGVVQGNNFVGCVRGIGGTTAAAHVNGSTITELNIRLSGYRAPSFYSVGQSATLIDVPPAWEIPIYQRMLAEVRESEQIYDEAAKLRSDFIAECKELAMIARRSTHKRQIPMPGVGGFRTFYANISGGILVT